MGRRTVAVRPRPGIGGLIRDKCTVRWTPAPPAPHRPAAALAAWRGVAGRGEARLARALLILAPSASRVASEASASLALRPDKDRTAEPHPKGAGPEEFPARFIATNIPATRGGGVSGPFLKQLYY